MNPTEIPETVQKYLNKDSRLKTIHDLAKREYDKANLAVHNYGHILWDTDKAIQISEKEKNSDTNLVVAISLLHDIGATFAPYKFHAENGSNLASSILPKHGFNNIETDICSQAILEHDGFEHTTNESKHFYDADTLNKSGFHGIEQYHLLAKEFNLSLQDLAERALIKIPIMQTTGFYTETAKQMNLETGRKGEDGMQVVLDYFTHIHNLYNKGMVTEKFIVNQARKNVGINDKV